MDLIDAISKILHFQYRFEMVPDGETALRFVHVCAEQSSVKCCFLISFSPLPFRIHFRQIRFVQQSHEAVGWPGEAFAGSSKSLTASVEWEWR